jgi:hypothetical protein
VAQDASDPDLVLDHMVSLDGIVDWDHERECATDNRTQAALQEVRMTEMQAWLSNPADHSVELSRVPAPQPRPDEVLTCPGFPRHLSWCDGRWSIHAEGRNSLRSERTASRMQRSRLFV